MSRDKYNTKQKDLILDVIKKHRHEFTIKDIHNEISDSAGLTTIYRVVDKLVSMGRLNKYINNENITYYQYLDECEEENHFYLKCEKCGDMIHVDCDCIKELSDHIIKEHKFIPTKKNIIIKGICNKCKES